MEVRRASSIGPVPEYWTAAIRESLRMTQTAPWSEPDFPALKSRRIPSENPGTLIVC